MCSWGPLDLRNWCLTNKTETDGPCMSKYKYICVGLRVDQCLFKTTTLHRQTSVSASAVGANLGSNQTSFFFCLVSEVPFESSQTPLLCLSQLRISQKAAVDVKRCDGWGVLWNNEDHFFSPWLSSANGAKPTQRPQRLGHTLLALCVFMWLYIVSHLAWPVRFTYLFLYPLNKCSLLWGGLVWGK